MNIRQIICIKKIIFTFIILLTIIPFPFTSVYALPSNPVKKAAIVIDDFGNNMKGTVQMIHLPFPITVAIMPFLPTTQRDAQWAHEQHHDVIVHLPMEPIRGKKSWLGPGAITINLSNDEIRKRVNAAIDNVPYAVGVNNHMGSKATADERVMRVVLEVCHERGLFFLDSGTNYKSKVSQLADEIGVHWAKNSIFLDDIHSIRHIQKRILALHTFFEKHNQCILIGHVGTAGKLTANTLLRVIPTMQKSIDFVTLSQLIQPTLIK